MAALSEKIECEAANRLLRSFFSIVVSAKNGPECSCNFISVTPGVIGPLVFPMAAPSVRTCIKWGRFAVEEEKAITIIRSSSTHANNPDRGPAAVGLMCRQHVTLGPL